MDKVKTPSDEELALLEYAHGDGKPFQATYRQDGGLDVYDIDWCRRDKRLYYHLSGFGGQPWVSWVESRYWLAPGEAKPKGYPGHGMAMTRRPRKYGQPIDEWATEGDCYWCPACKDMIPQDDPCKHGEPSE